MAGPGRRRPAEVVGWWVLVAVVVVGLAAFGVDVRSARVSADRLQEATVLAARVAAGALADRGSTCPLTPADQQVAWDRAAGSLRSAMPTARPVGPAAAATCDAPGHTGSIVVRWMAVDSLDTAFGGLLGVDDVTTTAAATAVVGTGGGDASPPVVAAT